MTSVSWLASVREFPETKKERVPSKHFEFPEVSMETRGCLCSHSCSAFWQLSSFPESESWFGAKSEAKPRKPANYAGIFQVYPGVFQVSRKISQYFADLADLDAAQTSLTLRLGS